MSLRFKAFHFCYKTFAKPVFFLFDAEFVHDFFTTTGRILRSNKVTRKLTSLLFSYQNKNLEQTIFGIKFKNPVGLSAGFDYNGYMNDLMGDVGFGFASIGTVTYSPYEGNKKPRLGRLPKSKSLLVNKGFKSAGIKKVLENLPEQINDDFVLGISIGATNSKETSTPDTQIEDIINSFKYLLSNEKEKLFSYYELNISCPNVLGSGSLSKPQYLEKVLSEIRKLNIKKPIFLKFQLEIEWEIAKKLIEIMIKYNVDAIIIANLLKNPANSTFDDDELNNFKKKNLKGNFSGKPTFDLSNELISKVYKEFGDKIKIIGVGGIFNSEDAYEKIKRGACLVQLISGMIFEGPQLIGSINQKLVSHLSKDKSEKTNIKN